MSTTTITFLFRPAGVLTAATSCVFQDSGNTYGVRRTDTLASVVAKGTALATATTGIYTYTLTDPAYGLEYGYVVKVVYGGETYYIPGTAHGTPVSSAGYCSQSDLEAAITASSLLELIVDIDGESVGDAAPQARLTAAIAAGDARIDEALSSRYTVPVTGTIPEIIKALSVDCARVELYKRRPGAFSDFHKLLSDETNARLDALRDGKRDIPGLAMPTTAVSLPSIVGSANPLDSRPYLDGITDPVTQNINFTDPLAGY